MPLLPLVVRSVQTSPRRNAAQVPMKAADDPRGSATCSEFFPEDDREESPIRDQRSEPPDAGEEEILSQKSVKYLAYEPRAKGVKFHIKERRAARGPKN